MQYLPAQSNESLFTRDGGFHIDNIWQSLGKYGCIVNMDSESGMGNHWICLCMTPKIVFYYDPLLPNKVYEVPKHLKRYLEKFQQSGGRVIMNYSADQGRFLPRSLGMGASAPDEMCGAYSAMMMLAMDRAFAGHVGEGNQETEERWIKEFYREHSVLDDPKRVRLVYDKIRSL